MIKTEMWHNNNICLESELLVFPTAEGCFLWTRWKTRD